jgi:hypothetical protein
LQLCGSPAKQVKMTWPYDQLPTCYRCNSAAVSVLLCSHSLLSCPTLTSFLLCAVISRSPLAACWLYLLCRGPTQLFVDKELISSSRNGRELALNNCSRAVRTDICNQGFQMSQLEVRGERVSLPPRRPRKRISRSHSLPPPP